MPYIKHRDWIDTKLEPMIAALVSDPNISAGEINYTITQVLLAWLPTSPRYEDYNKALGVLEAVKLELYRRMVAPYEDAKCAENGDVYL